jgi:hypothetical protein
MNLSDLFDETYTACIAHCDVSPFYISDMVETEPAVLEVGQPNHQKFLLCIKKSTSNVHFYAIDNCIIKSKSPGSIRCDCVLQAGNSICYIELKMNSTSPSQATIRDAIFGKKVPQHITDYYDSDPNTRNRELDCAIRQILITRRFIINKMSNAPSGAMKEYAHIAVPKRTMNVLSKQTSLSSLKKKLREHQNIGIVLSLGNELTI